MGGDKKQEYLRPITLEIKNDPKGCTTKISIHTKKIRVFWTALTTEKNKKKTELRKKYITFVPSNFLVVRTGQIISWYVYEEEGGIRTLKKAR